MFPGSCQEDCISAADDAFSVPCFSLVLEVSLVLKHYSSLLVADVRLAAVLISIRQLMSTCVSLLQFRVHCFRHRLFAGRPPAGPVQAGLCVVCSVSMTLPLLLAISTRFYGTCRVRCPPKARTCMRTFIALSIPMENLGDSFGRECCLTYVRYRICS
jgi:hypothetical protein